MTKVLFVCVANGGRSVLAERMFNQLANGRHEARSAGSEPGPDVHPVVVEALAEIGLDASGHVPRKLDAATTQWSELIVSTCSEGACPVTYGRRRLRWEIPDPKNLPLGQVRLIRDDIQERVRELVVDLDGAATLA